MINRSIAIHEERFQLPVHINVVSWEMLENANVFIMFMFPNMNSVQQGLTHCGLVTPYDNVDLGQYWLR